MLFGGRHAPRLGTICILAGLAALLASLTYRARTQPITVDEARMYKEYIQPGRVAAIFIHPFDSGNHVLQTLASFLTVRLSGTSELALRTPTLIGAFFYFVAVWKLAFLAFRRTLFAALAIGMMALNPLV